MIGAGKVEDGAGTSSCTKVRKGKKGGKRRGESAGGTRKEATIQEYNKYKWI